ncbi:MAG: hypothetical protein CL920_19715 [Deltaproteobacteria bacterium]|nr:hypothetical protein [Deltaproteobacteria bacterium]
MSKYRTPVKRALELLHEIKRDQWTSRKNAKFPFQQMMTPQNAPQTPTNRNSSPSPKAHLSNIWGDTVSLNIVIVLIQTSRLDRLRRPTFAHLKTLVPSEIYNSSPP